MIRDWRSPRSRVKGALTGIVKSGLSKLGLWVPTTSCELATRQTYELAARGDVASQHCLVYQTARPEFEAVGELVYTPQGIAVQRGRVVQRYSSRAPSVLEILKGPIAAGETLEAGTVIETETPYTYGDWVADYLGTLVNASEIAFPVVVPGFLAQKPYVARDLETLGVDYVAANRPVAIRNARVLRKRIPSYYWGEREVQRFRDAFGIKPIAPRKGSMTYLGRFGTLSEAVQRKYPSEETARIVEDLGGNVFDARNASPDSFDDLAGEVETVIADQGSALFGVLRWRTRNVIELTTRRWWHNANLFFANGAGVRNYAVIHVDGIQESTLRTRIGQYLDEFRA